MFKNEEGIIDLTWIEVADTATKIGLGAFITAFAGFMSMWLVHRHEVQKELKNHFYKIQDDKKIAYINFPSLSQNLVQSHIFKSCSCDTDEYKDYLMAYNVVQILSDDKVRLQAFELLNSVNAFVIANKKLDLIDYFQNLRNDFDLKLSLFQKVAQLEVTAVYSSS